MMSPTISVAKKGAAINSTLTLPTKLAA